MEFTVVKGKWFIIIIICSPKTELQTMYMRHYKIFKKERKLQLHTINCQKQIKGKLAAANDLNFLQKFWYWVVTPTEIRKTSLLPKLWEGFIHPHMDRMNKFFARLVRTGRTLHLWLLYGLYGLSCDYWLKFPKFVFNYSIMNE